MRDEPFVERTGGHARALADRFFDLLFGSVLAMLLGLVRLLAPALRVLLLLMTAGGAIWAAAMASNHQTVLAALWVMASVACVLLRMLVDRLVTVRIRLR